MSLCLAAAAMAMSLAVDAFTLRWTHSVERTEWQERWQVEGGELVLQEARVRGSGAGMEPGEGAVLLNGWWVWRGRQRVPGLQLAVSGATGGGWWLCTDAGCDDVEAALTLGGRRPETIVISARPDCVPRER